jgi:hypothetical protein
LFYYGSEIRMKASKLKHVVPLLLLLSTLVAAQSGSSDQLRTRPQALADQASVADEKGAPPAEDISGMYSFLREGEFVQINLEQNVVSGYISRRGDLDSDRGAFLDQFFSKASVHGHDVQFVTRPLHGVSYEFKGRFERGPSKTKADDGYYVLRGTLKEIVNDGSRNTTSRTREVAFKSLGQPPEESEKSKD